MANENVDGVSAVIEHASGPAGALTVSKLGDDVFSEVVRQLARASSRRVTKKLNIKFSLDDELVDHVDLEVSKQMSAASSAPVQRRIQLEYPDSSSRQLFDLGEAKDLVTRGPEPSVLMIEWFATEISGKHYEVALKFVTDSAEEVVGTRISGPDARKVGITATFLAPDQSWLDDVAANILPLLKYAELPMIDRAIAKVMDDWSGAIGWAMGLLIAVTLWILGANFFSVDQPSAQERIDYVTQQASLDSKFDAFVIDQITPEPGASILSLLVMLGLVPLLGAASGLLAMRTLNRYRIRSVIALGLSARRHSDRRSAVQIVVLTFFVGILVSLTANLIYSIAG